MKQLINDVYCTARSVCVYVCVCVCVQRRKEKDLRRTACSEAEQPCSPCRARSVPSLHLLLLATWGFVCELTRPVLSRPCPLLGVYMGRRGSLELSTLSLPAWLPRTLPAAHLLLPSRPARQSSPVAFHSLRIKTEER